MAWRKRQVVGVALAWAVTTAAAQAADFYVAPGGSDSNPGTLALPWATPLKAARTLTAGDTVYLRQGTYAPWNINLRNGTASAPITFAAYPGEQPVIDGGGQKNAVVMISNSSNLRFSGLEVTNGSGYGFMTWTCSNIDISGNYIHNTGGSGINLNWTSGAQLNNNQINQACLAGNEECISVKLHSSDVTVSGNHIWDSPKEGIDAKEGVQNVTVTHNVISNCTTGLYTDAWNVPTSNIEFSHNVISNCVQGIAAGSEQGGLLDHVVVTNNVVYNIDGPGLVVQSFGGGTSHPMQDISFVNNTVYNAGNGWGGGMWLVNDEATDILVRNNIFVGNWQAFHIGNPDVPTNMTIDHNLVDTLRNMPAGWGFLGNPEFVDLAGGDFHLLPGSSAIDAGSGAFAPAVDMDGVPRPQGLAIDIGAYEVPEPGTMGLLAVGAVVLLRRRRR